MIRTTLPRQVNATWRMSPVGLSDRPEPILAVIAAGIFPDQDRPRENSGAIVKTDATFAQRLEVLCVIPLEFHSE
jgi:hypothetical protein